MERAEGIKLLTKHITDQVVVSNLGPTSNELWQNGAKDNYLYTYGSMGLVSSMALGVALSSSKKVIAFDGDGALLMNLGTLGTIGRQKPKNLIHVVWDNEEWGQTGHQPSHTSAGTSLEKVAAACGIAKTATVRNLEDLEGTFLKALKEDGPWCIVAKIKEPAVKAPYIAPIDPEMTTFRVRNYLGGTKKQLWRSSSSSLGSLASDS